MTALSIVREDGPATLIANPIFLRKPVSWHNGAEVIFEVLEADVGRLLSLLNTFQCLYADEAGGPFWARLKSLKPCISTVPGLGLLREKPTLCGVLEIATEVAGKQ